MTDGNKWEDPWFCELSSIHKLLHIYLCDRCDCAGIWRINLKQLAFHTGATEDEWHSFVAVAGNARLQFIESDKVWLVKYIPFQIQRGFNHKNNVVLGIAKFIAHTPIPTKMLPDHYAMVLRSVVQDLHIGRNSGETAQIHKPLEGASRGLKGDSSPLKPIKDPEPVKVKVRGKGKGSAVSVTAK